MSRSIYDSRQWWTYIFITIAVLIVIATVYFSNSLSKKLAEEERVKAEIWAEAIHVISAPDTIGMFEDPLSYKSLELKYNESQGALLNFSFSIIEKNLSIPTILCDENDSIIFIKNFIITEKDTAAFQKSKLIELKAKNPPIVIEIDSGNQFVYYDDSVFLKRLMMFPYVQLSIVFAFILLSFVALLGTKKAEQNKVWVGLSKETAHQLGTPISSLIAWVEYLKTKDVEAGYLKEMEKDVKRLGMIADRFSKIGSNPNLLPMNVNEALLSSCEYMSTRISSKVSLNTELSDNILLVLMNDSLFSWVIENITKNAVDAMEGQGSITYHIEDKGRKVYLDISDTGKGLPKSRYKTIFNPGYTTKTRGWGLGLSLVKRIIESYPGGKIFVKTSEIGKGTTFRIELRKYVG